MNEEKITAFYTPVLFIIFNRPDTTRQVFEAIRKIKPIKLYIAADGPRLNKYGEVELCEETRKITENIDWSCEVFRKYSDKNLGCKIAPSSAIDWLFKNEEEGIILEDDCLPSSSFFVFTSEMLDRYRNNREIMHISGTNFQFGKIIGDASYYFSRIPQSWGWATWRRAWKTFDVNMTDLEEYSSSKDMYTLFKNKKVVTFFINLFRHIKYKNIDAWDAQWVYSFLKNKGIAITPNINLVENIGFGDSATHTKDTSSLFKQKHYDMSTILHPLEIKINEEADEFVFFKLFYRSFFDKVRDRIKLYLKI